MSEILRNAEQRLTAVGRNIPMLREALAKQAALAVTAQEVFAILGIPTEPVAAEAVQQQMLAEGVRAEDNAFSRSILEMREE